MKPSLGAALSLFAVLAAAGAARADEPGAKTVLDRAIKALGGEEKLAGVKAFTTKGKGTVVVNGDEIPFTLESTARGIGQYRSHFLGEADGNKISGMTVIDGDKGWRKFNDDTQALSKEEFANEKRNVYLQVGCALLVPLKGKGFKLDLVGEEKVGGKPASAVRVTGPDDKDFTIYFDKETGLPSKLTARVADWQGQEFTQETTMEDYKEFDGIKVATKEKNTRDGERYVDIELLDFKPVKDVDPGTFAEPK